MIKLHENKLLYKAKSKSIKIYEGTDHNYFVHKSGETIKFDKELTESIINTMNTYGSFQFRRAGVFVLVIDGRYGHTLKQLIYMTIPLTHQGSRE